MLAAAGPAAVKLAPATPAALAAAAAAVVFPLYRHHNLQVLSHQTLALAAVGPAAVTLAAAAAAPAVLAVATAVWLPLCRHITCRRGTSSTSIGNSGNMISGTGSDSAEGLAQMLLAAALSMRDAIHTPSKVVDASSTGVDSNGTNSNDGRGTSTANVSTLLRQSPIWLPAVLALRPVLWILVRC